MLGELCTPTGAALLKRFVTRFGSVPVMTPGRTPNFGAGDGETSLLDEGGGETTLLSSQQMPVGALVRKSTGEKAIINKQLFVIGKERSKVDFCISDNNSISRVHANILYKNGAFYIVDQRSSNFTFVNGNKVNPGQEVKLNNGDKIKMSDEEFVFNA